MALNGKLQFGDNSSQKYDDNNVYLITALKCRVSRHHNNERADSGPLCGDIEVTVVAPDKNNPFLYDWYVNQSCLSGRLALEVPNGKFTALKNIEFNDAVCCCLSENYHIDLNRRRTLTLTIMASTMVIDELTFNSDLICQTQQQS